MHWQLSLVTKKCNFSTTQKEEPQNSKLVQYFPVYNSTESKKNKKKRNSADQLLCNNHTLTILGFGTGVICLLPVDSGGVSVGCPSLLRFLVCIEDLTAGTGLTTSVLGVVETCWSSWSCLGVSGACLFWWVVGAGVVDCLDWCRWVARGVWCLSVGGVVQDLARVLWSWSRISCLTSRMYPLCCAVCQKKNRQELLYLSFNG